MSSPLPSLLSVRPRLPLPLLDRSSRMPSSWLPLASDLPSKPRCLQVELPAHAASPCADSSLVLRLALVAVILLGLSAGWIIRYSRRASKFRAFWNQPTQDYELKQHHAALLKQGGMKSDDASSIRSKVSVATTVPKSTSTAHHHGRSPLATYEDVNVGDRQCTSMSSPLLTAGA
jgi:hypothetical protein